MNLDDDGDDDSIQLYREKYVRDSVHKHSACRSLFVLFLSKHDVKSLLRLKNKICRLFHVKRKLSVFYYIVELF